MKRWEKIGLVLWCMLMPAIIAAGAQIVSGLPFTLTNGTVADATQIMSNFNQIVNNTNANAAKNGVNADITALSALSTPLTAAQGGTTLFIGGTSTGTANAQVVATPVPTGFALANKPTLYFNPGFTNTGALTLNANASGVTNVYKTSFSGPVALTGGEVRFNQLAQVTYDGTQYVLNDNLPAFGVATNLTSATTTDLGTVASHIVQVTGTTTITGLGSTASVDAPLYVLRFSGALTLTYNATSLILPGAASITTAANDTASALYLGSGNWQIASYTRAAVQPYLGTAPTVQRITVAGSGTYTPAANTVRIRVRMCGPGGGGGARVTNAGNNGTADTALGTWTAVKGSGGAIAATGTGGAGGTAGTDGTGLKIVRLDGANGSGGATGQASSFGFGSGGSSPFGGAGASVVGTGGSAKANTCSGGGGQTGSGTASGSGGAGEYVEFWMTAAQIGASLSYTVGGKGTGGAAGTTAGGDGADGIIVIEEFYW